MNLGQTFEGWLKEVLEQRISALRTARDLVKDYKNARYDQIQNKGKFIEYKGTRSYMEKIKVSQEYEINTVKLDQPIQTYYSWRNLDRKDKKEYINELVYLNAIIEFKGQKIKETLSVNDRQAENDYYASNYKDGIKTVLETNGLTMTEYETAEGRDDEWINKRAEKENQELRLWVEKKVKAICGDEILEATEVSGELLVKGSNGRIAKIWSVRAGGYNIQRLHTRLYVKEHKTKGGR
jgi:hypothetical protein